MDLKPGGRLRRSSSTYNDLFALAAFRGEVPHQVFVGIAQEIITLGAVLAEIQTRILEDRDPAGQALHHLFAATELIGVVEIGKLAAAHELLPQAP